MIIEHFFPTIIYGKDVDLDNQWLENKVNELRRILKGYLG